MKCKTISTLMPLWQIRLKTIKNDNLAHAIFIMHFMPFFNFINFYLLFKILTFKTSYYLKKWTRYLIVDIIYFKLERVFHN